MDSRNWMDCGDRIRTYAAHSLEKWVYARGPTNVHDGSFPRTMANKLRWTQNESIHRIRILSIYRPKSTQKRPGSQCHPHPRKHTRHTKSSTHLNRSHQLYTTFLRRNQKTHTPVGRALRQLSYSTHSTKLPSVKNAHVKKFIRPVATTTSSSISSFWSWSTSTLRRASSRTRTCRPKTWTRNSLADY